LQGFGTQEVGELAERQPDPVAALIALARGHTVFCRRDVARVMMALRVEFSGQNHPVGREVHRISRTLVKRCASLIEAGRRNGSIPPGPPAKAVALAFRQCYLRTPCHAERLPKWRSS